MAAKNPAAPPPATTTRLELMTAELYQVSPQKSLAIAELLVHPASAVTDPPLPAPIRDGAPTPHRRRPRYSGKYPRRFEEKYKEHDPERYTETVAKVIAAGKTPAGTHRPIMVAEVLHVLAPQPGETGVDCTLGYGGHAQELLARLQPGEGCLGWMPTPSWFPGPRPACAGSGLARKRSQRTAATSPGCRRCWRQPG